VSKPSVRKKRRRIRLKRNDFIFLAVCLLVFGGFLLTVFGQEQKLSEIRHDTAEQEKQVAALEEEYEILEEEEAKNSGDEFFEAKAREEGYVHEDEVVFVVGN